MWGWIGLVWEHERKGNVGGTKERFVVVGARVPSKGWVEVRHMRDIFTGCP